jgi:hypothetical protein
MRGWGDHEKNREMRGSGDEEIRRLGHQKIADEEMGHSWVE